MVFLKQEVKKRKDWVFRQEKGGIRHVELGD